MCEHPLLLEPFSAMTLGDEVSHLIGSAFEHPRNHRVWIAADYQGRAFTLMGSLAGGMAPIGLLLASPLAEMTGVRAWYVTAGLVCLSMGVAGFLMPWLLRMEDSTDAKLEAPSALQIETPAERSA